MVILAIGTVSDRFSDDEPSADEVQVPASTTPRRPLPPLPATTDRIVPVPDSTVPRDQDLVLRVGQDIEPGLYANERDLRCSWERRNSSGWALAGGYAPHALVEVRAGEQLYSRGCGTWHLYVPPDVPMISFQQGDWLVGGDIAPGRYYLAPPGGLVEGCTWEIASGFRYAPDEIESTGSPTDGAPPDPTFVDLVAGQRFSPSSICGRWVVGR